MQQLEQEKEGNPSISAAPSFAVPIEEKYSHKGLMRIPKVILI
jgi:hypothetical protein